MLNCIRLYCIGFHCIVFQYVVLDCISFYSTTSPIVVHPPLLHSQPAWHVREDSDHRQRRQDLLSDGVEVGLDHRACPSGQGALLRAPELQLYMCHPVAGSCVAVLLFLLLSGVAFVAWVFVVVWFCCFCWQVVALIHHKATTITTYHHLPPPTITTTTTTGGGGDMFREGRARGGKTKQLFPPGAQGDRAEEG